MRFRITDFVSWLFISVWFLYQCLLRTILVFFLFPIPFYFLSVIYDWLSALSLRRLVFKNYRLTQSLRVTKLNKLLQINTSISNINFSFSYFGIKYLSFNYSLPITILTYFVYFYFDNNSITRQPSRRCAT